MNDLISIIIPVFNCEKYIKNCLDSILNQTYKNLEIILINDGSTDNSEKICKKYVKKDTRIIYIYQTNHGVSSARNKGISIAKGKYISFLDSDDIVHKKFIETLYNGMLNDSQMSVVGINKIFNYENLSFHNNFENSIIINKQDAYKRLFEDNDFFGFVWNKMYLKSIINKLESKPFDENISICEDTLFNSKYLMYCNKINFNKTKLHYYYQRPDSATKIKEFNEKKISVFKALDKIENIYNKHSKENLVYLYIFYLYNYYLIINLINETKSNYTLQKNTEKQKLKFIIKSNQISLIRKIKITLKFKFPILNFKIYNLLKKR